MSENKESKCSIKCSICEHYDKNADFCKEKEIKNCSKQVHTDFAQCESYIVSHKLVMF